MINAQDLYEAHVAAVETFIGEFADPMPTWWELSWPERDFWQSEADELNEARIENYVRT